MKKITIVLAIVLLTGLLAAQITGPRLGQIRAPESGEVVVRVGPGPFNLHMAVLGPGVSLNTSVSPYVLEVTPVPAVKDCLSYEVIDPAAGHTVPVDFVLGSLEVYRNGSLMTEPYDYTLSGQTVQFVAVQTPEIGDIVNLKYFPIPF